MIKRIIFDLDDTLINFDECIDKFYNLMNFNKYNILKEEEQFIFKALFSYENKHDKYSYDLFLNDINALITNKLSINNLYDIFSVGKYLVPDKKDEQLIDTLEYLSNKYELVVLTNFFTSIQKERLEQYGILKYFTKVYGGDITKSKPHKESYEMAIGFYNPDECIMIGDNLDFDVLKPLKYGIDAIWYTKNKNNINKNANVKTIESLQELKYML